jgi:hypothetical protein
LPQGTGVGIYVYSWDRATKKREIKTDEAEVVKEIFTMVATGKSFIKNSTEYPSACWRDESGPKFG